MFQLLHQVHRYRELIWILAVKELKVRYKRSALGFLWALINPLMMAAVYVLIFVKFRVARFGIDNYVIFLLCALFPFTFFQQSLSYSAQSLISNGSLIRKIYIPAIVFPLATVTANLLNFLFSLVPLVLFLFVFDHPFHPTWGYVPLAVTALVLFAAGCGFIVAAVSVFFHDLGHMLEILLRAYFFLSPVLYDLNHIDPGLHWALLWNPMVYLLQGFRQPIFYGELPSFESAFLSLAVGFLAVLIGHWFFRRFQHTFALYV